MNLLSKLFPGNDEAAKIEAAIVENDSLRAELTEAQAKITELSGLSAIIVEKDTEIVSLAQAKTDLEARVSEALETITAKDAEIAEAKASAAVIATETLASIGQPEPLAIEEGGETKSILDQFNELKGEEATRFYNQNRKAILAAQSKLNS